MIDWIDYKEFFEVELPEEKPHQSTTIVSFSTARKLVKPLKIKDSREWRELCRQGARPHGVPYNPDRTYREQWISWNHFLNA
jgi:hypothetical protein